MNASTLDCAEILRNSGYVADVNASTRLLSRLGIDHPIVCAPMAAGLSGAPLAAAVSRAGALGSIGMLSPAELLGQIKEAKRNARGRPIAAGLLMPFTRRAHVDALVSAQPTAVVLHVGFDAHVVDRLHAAGIFVIHQIGTAEQAARAFAEGADAVIAQGHEAGGHMMGVTRGEALLPKVLEVAGDRPVIVAGGVARADDVQGALARGAAAVMVGTRFLCTEEAGAHPVYKERVLGAERTIVTKLFGVGWSAPHRVVPNEATRRFCDENGDIAPWIVAMQRASEPLARKVAFAKPGPAPWPRTSKLPLLTPDALLPGEAAKGIEHKPIYAGETARYVRKIEGAEDVVRELVSART